MVFPSNSFTLVSSTVIIEIIEIIIERFIDSIKAIYVYMRQVEIIKQIEKKL